VHEELKNGAVEVFWTNPLIPALQLQPDGTPGPKLLTGQATEVQVEV